ncbi:MAG TPA: 50S ribosomal protein L21e [Candidatus Thermoplasmatota archaeon]|nr:50S ribosomal protein L21e [Candidatus Thermoplasmatota archaeon]
MAQRSRGRRNKTRYKLQREPRERGPPPPSRSLQDFPEGSSVAIVLHPAVHKGQPFHRFHGLTGVVTGKQGASFVVSVYEGNKRKTVIARPEHLKLQGAPAKA